jgi:hypothetical protein
MKKLYQILRKAFGESANALALSPSWRSDAILFT